MIKLLSTTISSRAANSWLLLSRIAIGAVMLTHGIPKFEHVIQGNMQFADPIGIGQPASLLLVVFAEVVCSILLIIGLITRFASAILIINMLVVVFVAMGAELFAKKELGFLYLLFYTGFCVLGAGKYSIDALITRKNRRRY